MYQARLVFTYICKHIGQLVSAELTAEAQTGDMQTNGICNRVLKDFSETTKA
jgi:hypothetical protein